eukprot:10477581-Ditylum_brightwellii.AAC.1
MAVLNVASYGPATVCLEASMWQDYAGGIMTSAIGCSQAFLDMNHCVQVVGYAYTDVSDGADEEENERSGSGSSSQGSRDDSQRQGYWIVRNQWSSYWGMNGYAYVAMGENTCGILNDMTQVYIYGEEGLKNSTKDQLSNTCPDTHQRAPILQYFQELFRLCAFEV